MDLHFDRTITAEINSLGSDESFGGGEVFSSSLQSRLADLNFLLR